MRTPFSTSSSTRARAVLVAGVLASAFLLSGCLGGQDLGGSDSPPPGTSGTAVGAAPGPEAAVLVAAATRTTETGSAKLDMTMSLSLPGAAERVDVRLEGAFDLAAQRGRFVFDYGSLMEALSPESQQVSALLPDRMVFDTEAVYLRMPQLVELVPDGKKWVKLDVEELAAQQGVEVTGVD